MHNSVSVPPQNTVNTENLLFVKSDLWHSRGVDHPGEVIRIWRKAAKLSLPALARLSKIDKGTISRLERKGFFHPEKFKVIVEALHRKPSEVWSALSGAEVPISPAEPGAYVCRNPAHAQLHEYLDEILASQDRLVQIGIVANIVGMRERATRQPTDLPPGLEDQYLAGLPPASIKVVRKK